MKSLDELLEPIDGDNGPAGPDMDESPEFDEIRGVFDANFKYDAKVLEPDENAPDYQPGDWDKVADDIETLFGQTKDLYLAASYARSGIVLGEIKQVESGILCLAQLLETQWEDVNPSLDELGYQGRASICEEIAAYNTFALPFLEMRILGTNRASVTGDQLREALEHGAASNHYPLVMGVLDELDDDAKTHSVEILTSIMDGIDRIGAVMKEHGGSDAPDFSTPRDTVEVVRSALSELSGLGAFEDETSEDLEGAPTSGSGRSFSGKISSRDDVLQALKDIETYYAMAEPSHPVRISLKRMQSWVNKDFMQILADIAPRSMDEARLVLMETSNENN